MTKDFGIKPIATPIVVETPLPPRNRKSGLKICPSIAPAPARAAG